MTSPSASRSSCASPLAKSTTTKTWPSSKNAIGRDIRSYFLKDFYNDHVKMYKKRPIYWLFSSPKGSFNALIYMHRYRPDTVSVVLNGYLREYQRKLHAHKAHLEQVSISSAPARARRPKP